MNHAGRSLMMANLRARRKLMHTMTGKRPRKRLKRLPRQQHPTRIAESYLAALRRVLEGWRAIVDRRVVSRLGQLVRQAAHERGLHADSVGDDVNDDFDAISEEVFKTFGTDELDNIIAMIGERTSDFQKAQLMAQLKAATGVDLAFIEKGLQGRIDDFVASNVSLIKSVANQYLDQVQNTIMAGLRGGERAEDIASDVADRFGVSESRAALIARDQVGKFYGELNEARQQQLGVESYIWRTSLDERVREEHAAREGVKFAWDDPPEDGNPGEPINCRCSAEPDLSGILDEL